jgi:hypothetical protein
MTARGNKWETRWPGLMRSVADGSTYSAPVVETGSSFHSSPHHKRHIVSLELGIFADSHTRRASRESDVPLETELAVT